MGECEIIGPDREDGEEKLIDAANYLLSALSSGRKLSRDARKVLANVGAVLSSALIQNDHDDEDMDEIEGRLNVIHEKIMSWESDQSMIWDSGQNEATKYLNYVEESRKLIEKLEVSGSRKNSEDLLRKAHDVLQTAMARLEDEFKHMLAQNQLPFGPENLSCRLSEEDELSVTSFNADSFEESLHRDSISRTSGEIILDLVHPEAIPELKSIANAMFKANYDRECMQGYISVRKDAIDDLMISLETEKLSIEDVIKMDWSVLHSKIKKWVHIIRKITRVYLASEKWLSDQILGDHGSVGLSCFIDLSKGSMLQLLNFGEAVALGARQPEKLFKILDMYEVLAEVAPDVEALYAEEVGLSIRTEFQHVMKRLGDCVRAIFLEFKKAIESNASTNPFPGGGIHPLTNYVMNYLRLLTDYSETVDSTLKEHDDVENLVPVSPGMSPGMSPGGEKEDSGENPFSVKFPEMTLYCDSISRVLETNLLEKSRLYRNVSLQHFFLMNNLYYMAQKVKNSELKVVLGEKWLKKRTWKFQQHAMEYERATWNSILTLLKDEPNSGSSSNFRTHSLRDRFQNFYMAFEEVYKTQTAWQISDDQLREDLRISASLKVIQAYRMFYSRHKNNISDRHVKYSADDLEKHLLDLFGGSQRSLSNSYRR